MNKDRYQAIITGDINDRDLVTVVVSLTISEVLVLKRFLSGLDTDQYGSWKLPEGEIPDEVFDLIPMMNGMWAHTIETVLLFPLETKLTLTDFKILVST